MKKIYLGPSIGRASMTGATLILSLVLLTVVMFSAMSGMETVRLQEKMVSHSYDRKLGLQGAELAISMGEERAREQALAANADFPERTTGGDNKGSDDDDDDKGSDDKGNMSANFNNCNDGLCTEPDAGDMPRWKSDDFQGWKPITNIEDERLGNPEYFVEFLGDDFPCTTNPNGRKDCSRYRITARSGLEAGRSKVMVQSVYATN